MFLYHAHTDLNFDKYFLPLTTITYVMNINVKMFKIKKNNGCMYETIIGHGSFTSALTLVAQSG